MAVKPTTNPTDWATDTTGVALKIETSDYHKQYGWGIISGVPEVPNLNEVNYWRFSVHQWLQYLDLSGEERDVDIATVNSRIDNLSSDQVSYQFSNDSVGNLYDVPFSTFTEFDGTTSTKYTDDGSVTSLVNSQDMENIGVLSQSNPNNTNDTMVSSLAEDAYGNCTDASKCYVSTPTRNRITKTTSEGFNSRFKFKVVRPTKTDVAIVIHKFDPSTGNYGPGDTVGSYSGTILDIAVNSNNLGVLVTVYGNSGWQFLFYDAVNDTFESTYKAAPPLSPLNEANKPDVKNDRGQGFIFQLERSSSPGWAVAVAVTLASGQGSFFTDKTLIYVWRGDTLQYVPKFERGGDVLFEGFPPNTLDSRLARYECVFDIFPKPTFNNIDDLICNYVFFSAVANPSPSTGGTCQIQFSQGRIDLYSSIQSEPLYLQFTNTEPATWIDYPSQTPYVNDNYANTIRAFWTESDDYFTSAGGKAIVAFSHVIDQDKTPSSTANVTADNFYFFSYKGVNAGGDDAPVLIAKERIVPPNIVASESIAGVSSIDVIQKSGDNYTFLFGYTQNITRDVTFSQNIYQGMTVPTYDLFEEYQWDGQNFSVVPNSLVRSDVLTSDEEEAIGYFSEINPTKQSDFEFQQTAIASYSQGVKIVRLSGSGPLTPVVHAGRGAVYLAEVYRKGYFVYFKTNFSQIFNGVSTPPGIPNWGGTSRAVYFFSPPSGGVDTAFVSSLNNELYQNINGVNTIFISPQGIIEPTDGDEYAYSMCRFYETVELPQTVENPQGGLSVQYTTIKFLQYDAFVPGLGNVQAALDNLYSQIGSITRMEAFGGTEVNTTFDNHILSLVTPKRYTDTGVSLTSGVATTITHNLDQQIVQIAVYDESNDQKVDVDVTLVDANSLTITSSSTITVSVVVLK